MTRRLQPGTRLVVASHNPGKVREISELVAPYGLIGGVGGRARACREPEETGSTFADNAELKALAAARRRVCRRCRTIPGSRSTRSTARPASIRRAGPGRPRTFDSPCSGSADEVRERGRMDRRPGRAPTSRPRCASPGPMATAEVFEGKVFGHLVWPPRGARGFGYDPMFVADGETLTFGEMEPAAKHAISHRARAFAQFVAPPASMAT